MITPLLLPLALLANPHAGQDSAERFFADLLRWRTQFETVLVAPEEDESYHYVSSETLGGAHGEAFYPLGSAAERYMLSFNARVTLIFQKRRGQKAVVAWSLPVVESKSKAPVKGTLPKMLQRLGYRISPKAKLTSAMRTRLAATGFFATYSYHHFSGGYASVLRPDGTEMQVHKGEDKFVITPEEKELLRAKRKDAGS
jgi:hypothetical protein